MAQPPKVTGQGTSSVTVSLPPPRKAPAAPTPEPTRPSSAPHSPTTPNPGGAANDANEAPVKFMPVPNIMGDYYQTGYYFRWYLLSDTVDPGNTTERGITIAETGATGINLSDVKIEAIIGPNSQTRNSTATNITMTVVEPMGAMLPNVLYEAAVEMEIFNYHKAPWMLELKFMGQDIQGNRVWIDNKVWRWKMMLLDIDTKISESGATHTVTALPLQEMALDNQYCMLPEAHAVKGDTVGKVLEDLGTSMTKSADLKYGEGFLKFKFEDRPYKDSSSIASPFMHKLVAEEPTKNDARNQGIAQFSPGTDIPHVVDSLMAASHTALEQARYSRSHVFDPKKDQNNTGLDPEEDMDKMQPFTVMHRIDTEVKITGWHPVFQDYCREVTFVVRPYETIRLITNRPNASALTENTKFQRRKARHAVDRSYLTKCYDYIFTGMNTEVYNFDISLKFNWSVAVPMMGGKVHYGSSTIPQQVNEDLWQAQDAYRKVNAAEIAIQKFSDTVDANRENLTDEQEAGYDAKEKELNTRLDEIKSRESKALTDQIDKAKVDFDARRKRTQGKGGYAEAIVEEKESGPTKALAVMPLSITDDGDKPDASSDFGVSSQWHQGRSVYGSLLNQMYGAVDGNLLNIDLQVRGDPYWLGPDGFQVTDRDVDSQPESGNWMNGEHMFMFRFKIPQGYDSATGQVRLNKGDIAMSDTYNGIYTVIKVTHKFERGEFSQILNGTRVPGMVLAKVLEIGNDKPVEDGE